MNIKKDFKTSNTTNSLVSHNILTNHTFDFQIFVIFPFIHDKNKRIIFEACSTAHHNTITQRQDFFQNFTIYNKNNMKRIQNPHFRIAPLSLNIQSNKRSKIRFSNYKTPFIFQKENSIRWYDAIWTLQPGFIRFFHIARSTSPNEDFELNQNSFIVY